MQRTISSYIYFFLTNIAHILVIGNVPMTRKNTILLLRFGMYVKWEVLNPIEELRAIIQSLDTK